MTLMCFFLSAAGVSCTLLSLKRWTRRRRALGQLRRMGPLETGVKANNENVYSLGFDCVMTQVRAGEVTADSPTRSISHPCGHKRQIAQLIFSQKSGCRSRQTRCCRSARKSLRRST